MPPAPARRTSSKLPPRLNDELQKWASDRAQVLSRTVRGVMRYGDGLRVLARLEGLPEEQLEMTVASKFEFIVTSQIYGKLKRPLLTMGPHPSLWEPI